MKMRRNGIACIAVAALFAASCAHLPPPDQVKTPLVSLANVRYGDVGLMGMTMETDLQIENPNGFTVTIPYVNYDLYLNDIKCGRGTTSERLKVKAYSTKELIVPVQITFLNMVGSAARALKGKSGSYRIEGEVVVMTSAGDRMLPFRGEGTTDFLESPSEEQ